MNNETKIKLKRIIVIGLILLTLVGLTLGTYFLMTKLIPTGALCPDGQKAYGDNCFNKCTDKENTYIQKDKDGKVVGVKCIAQCQDGKNTCPIKDTTGNVIEQKCFDPCPSGQTFNKDTCGDGFGGQCQKDCSSATDYHTTSYYDKGWVCGQSCPNCDGANCFSDDKNNQFCEISLNCSQIDTTKDAKDTSKNQCDGTDGLVYCGDPTKGNYLRCAKGYCSEDKTYCLPETCPSGTLKFCSLSSDCNKDDRCTSIDDISSSPIVLALQQNIETKKLNYDSSGSNISFKLCTDSNNDPNNAISSKHGKDCIAPDALGIGDSQLLYNCNSSSNNIGINLLAQCPDSISDKVPCVKSGDIAANGWQVKQDNVTPMDEGTNPPPICCLTDYQTSAGWCCPYKVTTADSKKVCLVTGPYPQDMSTNGAYSEVGGSFDPKTGSPPFPTCESENDCSNYQKNLTNLIMKSSDDKYKNMSTDETNPNYTKIVCQKSEHSIDNLDPDTKYCQIAAGYDAGVNKVDSPPFTFWESLSDLTNPESYPTSVILDANHQPLNLNTLNYNTLYSYKSLPNEQNKNYILGCIKGSDKEKITNYLNDPSNSSYQNDIENLKYYWSAKPGKDGSIVDLQGKANVGFSTNNIIVNEATCATAIGKTGFTIPDSEQVTAKPNPNNPTQGMCEFVFNCSDFSQYSSDSNIPLKSADIGDFDGTQTNLKYTKSLYNSTDNQAKCEKLSTDSNTSPGAALYNMGSTNVNADPNYNCIIAVDSNGSCVPNNNCNEGEECCRVSNNSFECSSLPSDNSYILPGKLVYQSQTCSLNPNQHPPNYPAILASGQLGVGNQIQQNKVITIPLDTPDGINLCNPQKPIFGDVNSLTEATAHYDCHSSTLT